MELNTAYNVVHANKRRETQAIALQGNTAYNNDSTQDNGYTMVENNGRETFASKHNTAYAINREVFTTKPNSTSNILSNTNSGASQVLTKNGCAKKWFATLAVVVFAFLSLLVAVAALVYANIELKNQMISTNKQIQSINEQMNNQSSQLNDIQSIIAELNLYPETRIGNPARSCNNISQDRPSGEYWIAANSTSSPVQVYCDMIRTSCSCNTAGGWMRVANLDMTDPNQNCPERFRLVTRTTPPLRTCGQVEGQVGCTSTTYSTYGVEYSKVCGRIIAYQNSTPDAFTAYFFNITLSIDDVYVDGVSLTHGQSPRQHIWTFVNAIDETAFDRRACPCTTSSRFYTGAIPPFIDQDYFCETGSRQTFKFSIFYPDDPVWDGQGCGGTSTCCEFNHPPWFCKQLPQPTTDDIELRICSDEGISNEDTPIELVEIYVR